MSEPSPRDWRTQYAAAMLEGDSTLVPLRIERAEEAIQARLRELPETYSVLSEQADLQSALENLRLLKAARLTSAWPPAGVLRGRLPSS
jgi:hypothetical protein